jgi:hypothetical protein
MSTLEFPRAARIRATVAAAIAMAVATAITTLAAASPAFAQDSTDCHCAVRGNAGLNEFQRRSSGSVAFIQLRPLGALGSNIGFGYGATGSYIFRLDHAGVFGLRADLGFADYGNESKRVPLSETIGGRIQVKVSTNNYVVPFTIGPQLMVPTGSIRPYVNAGIGGQAFYTQSHIEGVDDEESSFATTTNQSDFTHAWVLGGGVYIPVYTRGLQVRMDLGAQYYGGGHAQYLKPGSIEDLPNAQIRVTPLESDTHMLLVRIGVNIGV